MKRLEVAIKAATAAGNLLMQHRNDRLNIVQKESVRDIVTEVDRIAESRILEVLKASGDDAPIITEEQRTVVAASRDSYWIVDALDGTVNYVNSVPFFSVSIAFIEAGELAVGVIYNPMANDLYYGARGVGIFKNQHVSRIIDKPTSECLFSVAFSGKSYEPAERRDEFLLMSEINDCSRGCLRTGSASMNLAFLAEGRFGGCWGKRGKFWDIAAGLLLAQLAGARVDYMPVDAEERLVNYVATVPSAWEGVYSRVARVLGLVEV